MADFHFKYGDGYLDFSYPDEDIIKVIEPTKVDIPDSTEREKVEYALDHPIGTGRLEDIISPDNTVCLIVPDTTRQWGRPEQIIRVVIDRLSAIGVKDDNILIVSATGTHKKQTPQEHINIVGEDIYKRI